MLDDILEEFSPKEVITIVIERRWKYRNPSKIVKQLWEIPVLVIRNTGKAILVFGVVFFWNPKRSIRQIIIDSDGKMIFRGGAG